MSNNFTSHFPADDAALALIDCQPLNVCVAARPHLILSLGPSRGAL